MVEIPKGLTLNLVKITAIIEVLNVKYCAKWGRFPTLFTKTYGAPLALLSVSALA